MRIHTVLLALVVFAVAAPAARAVPCREMGRAAEPATSGAVPASTDAGHGACCSAASGVCCLAPAPLVPASASVLPGATAAALVAVVLRPPSADPIRREVVPEQEVPWSPDRPGERGPRGPPAG